jgi:zinc transport system permease protein
MNLINILSYTFVQNSIIIGVIIGVTAPIVGQHLLVRRFSALADTLAHVSLVGIALSFTLHTHPILLALCTTIISSVLIEIVSRKKGGYSESILTLFLSAGLGISAIIISLGKGSSANIMSYLFGSINTVTNEDIWLVGGVCVIVLGLLWYMRKGLFVTALDSDIAQSQGFSPRIYNTIIMICAALVISVGIQAVGVLLISSLMILPVLTAMQLRRGFYQTMAISIVSAVFSIFIGIILSLEFDIATGGTIVLVNVGAYILVGIIHKLVRS